MKRLATGLMALGLAACGADSVETRGPYVDPGEQAVYPAPDEDPALTAPDLCLDEELAMEQIVVNEVDVEAACGKEATKAKAK